MKLGNVYSWGTPFLDHSSPGENDPYYRTLVLFVKGEFDLDQAGINNLASIF